MTTSIIRHDAGPMGWSVFGGGAGGFKTLTSITVLSAPDAGGQGMRLTLVGSGNWCALCIGDPERVRCRAGLAVTGAMTDPHLITRQQHERALLAGLADAAAALRQAARHDDTGQWADAILAVAACGALFKADDDIGEAFRARLCCVRLGLLQALRVAEAP